MRRHRDPFPYPGSESSLRGAAWAKAQGPGLCPQLCGHHGRAPVLMGCAADTWGAAEASASQDMDWGNGILRLCDLQRSGPGSPDLLTWDRRLRLSVAPTGSP